jgi:hypothetical protein
MKSYDENEVIYYLTMADLQRVSNESLNRNLTKDEIEKVIEKLPDYISWYESIDYAIREVFAK